VLQILSTVVMFTGLETQVDNSGFNNKNGPMSFGKTVAVTCPKRDSLNLSVCNCLKNISNISEWDEKIISYLL